MKPWNSRSDSEGRNFSFIAYHPSLTLTDLQSFRRVVGQPSSKTDYVVLGSDAGPAKLKAIKKHGLKTLTEDEFLNLIATRKGVVDEKTKAKMKLEAKKIEEAAKEMERAERREDKAAAKGEGYVYPTASYARGLVDEGDAFQA